MLGKGDLLFCQVEVVATRQSLYVRKQGPPEAIPFYGAVLFEEPSALAMRTGWTAITVDKQLVIPSPTFAAIANIKAYLHVSPGCRMRFTVIKTAGAIPSGAAFEVLVG